MCVAVCCCVVVVVVAVIILDCFCRRCLCDLLLRWCYRCRLRWPCCFFLIRVVGVVDVVVNDVVCCIIDIVGSVDRVVVATCIFAVVGVGVVAVRCHCTVVCCVEIVGVVYVIYVGVVVVDVVDDVVGVVD